MGSDFTILPLWLRIFVLYLVVGYCVQLPGVVFGHFLNLTQFQQYRNSNILVKILAGIFWLVFTILFWPIPFLRVGFNILAIELIVTGLLASFIMFYAGTTFIIVIAIILVAGGLSVALARHRGLKG
jgi:hypothetical protein